MKKIFAIGFVLLLLGSSLFADDAKVMPKMVGRLYVAPTYSFASGEYDIDGDYHSFGGGSVKVFNLGFALEYGIIDWLTAAVQWVPGWTPWSNIKVATKSNNFPDGIPNADTNGVADLFAGLKIQVAGAKAPVQTGNFRFAVAPGAIIPLPGPTFDEIPGDDMTLSSMDRHVFAAGARVYFDYIINKYFFINLYNETIFYPVKQDLTKDSPKFHAVKQGMAAATTNPLIRDIEGKINYGYRLTFEIEPVFTIPIVSGIDFSAGLPINYRYIPAPKYSFDYPAALAPAASQLEPQIMALGEFNTDPQHILRLNPNVSIFFMKAFLPLEFKFQYSLPVYGKNIMASHNATLQVKAYFALPGAR